MTTLDAVAELLAQPPETLDDLLTAITPGIYESLKQSIELQKWPDGSRLSPAQIENAMQLLILFEHHNLPEELRTGRPLNQSCGNDATGATQVIELVNNREVKDS